MSDEFTKNYTFKKFILKGVIITKENDYLITKVHVLAIKQSDGSFVIHHADSYKANGKTYWIDRADHEKNVVYYRERP